MLAAFHKEQLKNLYSSQNIAEVFKLKGTKWMGYTTCIGDKRCLYNVFLDNIQEERAWEKLHIHENIIMDLQSTMGKDMEWIYYLGQGPVLGLINMVISICVLKGRKFLTN